MKKVQKGLPGYLKYSKKHKGILLFVFALIIIGMLSAGNFTSESVSILLKVTAILNVLPASNIAVQFIAMFPYNSKDPEQYEAYRRKAPHVRLITELAVTNPSGPTTSIPYMAIGEKEIIGFYEMTGKPDTVKKLPSAAELSRYLEGRLRLSEVDMPIVLYTSESAFSGKLGKLVPLVSDESVERAEKAASALLANSF